jgi:hypothetical protein
MPKDTQNDTLAKVWDHIADMFENVHSRLHLHGGIQVNGLSEQIAALRDYAQGEKDAIDPLEEKADVKVAEVKATDTKPSDAKADMKRP